jgi:hypothetical protein
LSSTGARDATHEQAAAGAHSRPLVPAYRSTDDGTYHRANRSATHPGIDCSLIRAGAAHLILSVAATFEVIAAELIETLARTRKRHHAGATRYGSASGEQY